MNCLTINTDASYCYQTKASGYAFYIVCDLFKIQKGGMFKKLVSGPQQAEMMCIGNAIATVLKQQLPDKINLIVVNTDSKNSMDIFNGDSRSKKNKVLAHQVKGLIFKLRKKVDCQKVEFRHVKAHKAVKDSRSWVNHWCDKEARKWMEIQKQERLNLKI